MMKKKMQNCKKQIVNPNSCSQKKKKKTKPDNLNVSLIPKRDKENHLNTRNKLCKLNNYKNHRNEKPAEFV